MSRSSASVASTILSCVVYYVLVTISVTLQAADTTPPTIISTNPAPGTVLSNFTQITFVFSEPVVGVEPDDLQINGDGAASVNGIGGTNFTFSFTQPPAGTVYF